MALVLSASVLLGASAIGPVALMLFVRYRRARGRIGQGKDVPTAADDAAVDEELAEEEEEDDGDGPQFTESDLDAALALARTRHAERIEAKLARAA